MNTIDADIGKAIDILNDGGIVIFPTDTAFGIGCRVDVPSSVDRLFTLRKRPRSQATPVLVDSPDMALSYFVHPAPIVHHLMEKYWPGALTIISRCNPESVYSPVRGGTDTIGLRMPDHPTVNSILSGVGVAVLGPSANFHGEPTPFRMEDLDPELVRKVDFVVPGICRTGNVSTVVDTTGSRVAIVRQGAVVLRKEDMV